ncbi:MAG: hypothetical protein OTI34_16035 [Lewinella sp.]|nr:hypothetical protein [Lewinella sp.]
MKTLNFSALLALSTSLLFTACGSPATETMEPEAKVGASTEGMPADFVATLNAHGGLDNWKEFRQLSYAMLKGNYPETQLIDLHNRREYIRQPGMAKEDLVEMGFDGQDVWVTADTTYQGNPLFYKNLMFYFYAMPWVLADPGIKYEAAEPITYEGTTYPGIMVGYDDGIGYSSTDNYRLHYDPETGKMRWLGYTVTGDSGEVSDEFRWIEYPTWSDYDGVQLADSLVWYVAEESLPVEPRNVLIFADVKIGKKEADAANFARPKGARVVSE